MKNGPECDCGICHWCNGNYRDLALIQLEQLTASEESFRKFAELAKRSAHIVDHSLPVLDPADSPEKIVRALAELHPKE